MTTAIPAQRASSIRLVILDVDGVLTDGGVFIGATRDGMPVELKRFEITDSLGIRMLVWSGLHVAMVSGRSSAANRLRAEELGIACHEGPGGFKVEIVESLQAEHGIGWAETACVCDDLADLPIIRRAGLAIAVRNAAAEVLAAAHWRTSRAGGHGAVREFAEALLRARREWNPLVERYVRERDGSPVQ
jgi:3-deoxy-D-manno-octulosonate 8-phosphate phosphatase (KDO 8-P phosphatase)